MHLDTLSSLELVALMNDEDAAVITAVRDVLPEVARGVDLLVQRLSAGGHVLYVGAGTSGRLAALDAAEWRPTFGIEPGIVRAILAGGPTALEAAIEEAEDDEAGGAAAVHAAGRPGDVVVGITASGETPFVAGALQAARAMGLATMVIACNRPAAVARWADVAILPVTGPEVLTGSTRLKAGTAQKMVLNMLSTAAMVRLGKVYQNLMVDLRPTNQKLHRRILRAIQEATGAAPADAAAALEAAGYEARTAIVMLLTGLPPAAARQRLAGVGGFVRRAVMPGEGDPSPEVSGR